MSNPQVTVRFVHRNFAGQDIGNETVTLAREDLEIEYVEWIRNYCQIEPGDSVAIEEVR